MSQAGSTGKHWRSLRMTVDGEGCDVFFVQRGCFLFFLRLVVHDQPDLITSRGIIAAPGYYKFVNAGSVKRGTA